MAYCTECGHELEQTDSYCPECGAEIARLQQANPFRPAETVTNLFVLIDCLMAAFTHRKRALHDKMAESFCVYKNS